MRKTKEWKKKRSLISRNKKALRRKAMAGKNSHMMKYELINGELHPIAGSCERRKKR